MNITAHMSGWVVEICVEVGQTVQAGDPLLILESMKMQIPIESPQDGTVSQVFVKTEEVVQAGDPLIGLA